ncbi:stalk domain-containing protein [Paenibacillus sp. J22TS3]|uniref:stalk domain-containing protein n=1 Tax=Paenibacillus sp. J22TS3 TaxID=2807192 RepID=UPI001B09BF09|nr:hypothetical protein [Paenibacillus sp. J22TS3]GIP21773.1 hypothetical protein J22TS3_20480 [Paenibacillus sp. J22TS3]
MKKLIIGLTLGLAVGSTTMVAAGSDAVQATWQKYKIFVDGEQAYATANQLSYKGTTYVPIRETAALLDYSTNYNPKTKSIEFNSSPKQNQWISLLDLQAINNISIAQVKDKEGAYEVTRAGKLLLAIFSGDLKDGDQTVILDVNNKQIRMQKNLGALLLSKQDLKDAGFKVK